MQPATAEVKAVLDVTTPFHLQKQRTEKNLQALYRLGETNVLAREFKSL